MKCESVVQSVIGGHRHYGVYERHNKRVTRGACKCSAGGAK
jgi:hypothetical protein